MPKIFKYCLKKGEVSKRITKQNSVLRWNKNEGGKVAQLKNRGSEALFLMQADLFVSVELAGEDQENNVGGRCFEGW